MKPLIAFTFLCASGIWYSYGGNVGDFALLVTVELILIVWPGRILLASILKESSLLEQYIFGAVLGNIVIGALLKVLGLTILVALIPLVAAVTIRFFLNGSGGQAKQTTRLLLPMGILLVVHLLFLGLFLYGQYFFGDSTLHFHYFPAIDLTYFLTVLASLSHFGEFRDLAQLGANFNYTDLGYQFYALVHRTTDIEAFDLLVLFAPFKEYLLAALCIFTMCLRTSTPALAVMASAGIYLIGSRNMIEITVLSTNPAFRLGFATFLLGIWAWHFHQGSGRLVITAISLVSLIYVKPAIWLVVAPSFAFIALLVSARRRSPREVLDAVAALALSALIFILEFGPGRSGLNEDHYTLIFGRGLEATIKLIADRFNISDLRTEIIMPMHEVDLNSILLSLLFFFPFILLQIRHSAALLLLIFGWAHRTANSFYALHLTLIATLCFAYLAFLGFEYTGFLHGYMIPLASFVSLLAFAALWQARSHKTRGSRTIGISAVLLLALYGAGHSIYGFYHQRSVMPSFEIPIAIIQDYRNVRELTDTSAIIAVDNSDLFFFGDERSYLASAFIERRILSDGIYYGSLLMGYPENNRHYLRTSAADTIRVRRAARDSLFRSADPSSARMSASKYGVTHILSKVGGTSPRARIGTVVYHGKKFDLIKL